MVLVLGFQLVFGLGLVVGGEITVMVDLLLGFQLVDFGLGWFWVV